MDAIQAVLLEGRVFAPILLSALWRASIGGVLFAALLWAVCRLVPRLPASTRFWLWWMVSAKLLLELMTGAGAVLLLSPLVLRLPAQHPVAAPAFFVARLVVQPARLFSGTGGRIPVPVPPPLAATTATTAAALSAPAGEAAGSTPAGTTGVLTPSPVGPGLPSVSPDAGGGTGFWLGAGRMAAGLWCAGFLLRLVQIAKGALKSGAMLRTAVQVPESVRQEAHAVARRLGVRRLPPIVMHESAPSPFLVGLLRPTIVLPDPSRTPLSAAERRMALAHELMHLRRGDLWLALIPLLAEAAFFFLPVARWLARECDACREEICDSAAVASLGDSLLADYGQLLLKVTLASQSSGQAAPQMGMAVASSPAFVQLRRRLTALKRTINHPASPALRRAATVLLALCLPGMLPWHLRALPQGTAVGQESGEGALLGLPEYHIVDLGTLGGKFSDAYGIGEGGAIVGTANVFPLGGRGHAFLWQPGRGDAPNGKMADLCEGSVYRHSLAYGVNRKGQVVAAAFNNSLKPSAFVWTPGGNLRRYLGNLPGFHYSRATGINNDGVVVGAAVSPDTGRRGATRMRAFSWQDGRMADMGTLGGDFSAAVAISDSGHIVGKSDTGVMGATGAEGSSTTHAAFWESSTAKPLDIGTLPGGGNSAASAVNSRGDVVGYSEVSDAPRRAFLYTDGALKDLGALPVLSGESVPISLAGGINDAGWIVGFSSAVATDPESMNHPKPLGSRAVVWQPENRDKSRHRLIDLNNCISPNDHWSLESARAINNRGEIVGVGLIDGKRHGFLLRPVIVP